MTDDRADEPTSCCEELREHDSITCDVHPSPWDCADAVIVRRLDGSYGLPVRDGPDASASSSISIRHCPWCGSPLPGHATRPAAAADRVAGARAREPVGERPIVRAAEAGDLDRVRALLDDGVPALDRDPSGWTALHAAAVRSHRDVVRLLLESGAEVDVVDDDSFTPLLNAAGAGDAPTVRLLVEAGADVDHADPGNGWTPVSRAAEHGNADVLALLLDAGADPDAGDAVVAAAEAGSLACVQQLLDAGADPGARVDGETAADLARHHGHEEVARLLEQAGGVERSES